MHTLHTRHAHRPCSTTLISSPYIITLRMSLKMPPLMPISKAHLDPIGLSLPHHRRLLLAQPPTILHHQGTRHHIRRQRYELTCTPGEGFTPFCAPFASGCGCCRGGSGASLGLPAPEPAAVPRAEPAA